MTLVILDDTLLQKGAMCIAAAWLHNILMVWSPWSGKTLLARAIQSILPPLNHHEILEVSQIYSVVGKLDKYTPLVVHRPFRPIHHTASKISIIWWWSALRPWEVSLAHRGILFMDELTEFPRETLEVLRQPIEDKTITISRVKLIDQLPGKFYVCVSHESLQVRILQGQGKNMYLLTVRCQKIPIKNIMTAIG